MADQKNPTGRTRPTKPDLQNIPIVDRGSTPWPAMGRPLRYHRVVCDYSQIERRVLEALLESLETDHGNT